MRDIVVAFFQYLKDLHKIIRTGAWAAIGAFLMMEIWDRTRTLEEVHFGRVTFWVQIRGIPPEMISRSNIERLVAKADEVI